MKILLELNVLEHRLDAATFSKCHPPIFVTVFHCYDTESSMNSARRGPLGQTCKAHLHGLVGLQYS